MAAYPGDDQQVVVPPEAAVLEPLAPQAQGQDDAGHGRQRPRDHVDLVAEVLVVPGNESKIRRAAPGARAGPRVSSTRHSDSPLPRRRRRCRLCRRRRRQTPLAQLSITLPIAHPAVFSGCQGPCRDQRPSRQRAGEK